MTRATRGGTLAIWRAVNFGPAQRA